MGRRKEKPAKCTCHVVMHMSLSQDPPGSPSPDPAATVRVFQAIHKLNVRNHISPNVSLRALRTSESAPDPVCPFSIFACCSGSLGKMAHTKKFAGPASRILKRNRTLLIYIKIFIGQIKFKVVRYHRIAIE